MSADDLVLQVEGLAPAGSAILYMGVLPPVFPLHNGLRCVGGQSYRFPPQSIGSGTITLGPGLGALAESLHGAAAQLVSPSTWCFQAWYRDPEGPCGQPSNLSNGLRVELQP